MLFALAQRSTLIFLLSFLSSRLLVVTEATVVTGFCAWLQGGADSAEGAGQRPRGVAGRCSARRARCSPGVRGGACVTQQRGRWKAVSLRYLREILVKPERRGGRLAISFCNTLNYGLFTVALSRGWSIKTALVPITLMCDEVSSSTGKEHQIHLVGLIKYYRNSWLHGVKVSLLKIGYLGCSNCAQI